MEEQGGEPIADADRQYIDYTLNGEDTNISEKE